jgi:DUF1365 family protein
VTHHRFAPKVHRFSYAVVMFLLYLDEFDELDRDVAQLRLEGDVTENSRPRRLSNVLPGHYVVRRSDFLPQYPGTLDEAARAMHLELFDEVAPRRVAMLTNLRSLGWNFNPITLYFFFDDERVVRTVAEVTNTPWNERHLYPLGVPGSSIFAKQHHVSPFLEMDGTYKLTYGEPLDHFALSMTLHDNDSSSEVLGTRRFSASMSLDRRALTRDNVRDAGLRFPDAALRGSLRIYFQAARLFAKRVKYVPHPTKDPKGTHDVRAH